MSWELSAVCARPFDLRRWIAEERVVVFNAVRFAIDADCVASSGSSDKTMSAHDRLIFASRQAALNAAVRAAKASSVLDPTARDASISTFSPRAVAFKCDARMSACINLSERSSKSRSRIMAREAPERERPAFEASSACEALGLCRANSRKMTSSMLMTASRSNADSRALSSMNFSADEAFILNRSVPYSETGRPYLEKEPLVLAF